MKNYLKFIVPLLFFFGTIYPHELRTPKGTIVSHTHPSDSGWSDGDSGYHTADWWTTYADQYWAGLYIERLDRANQAYNCHTYAWADSRQSNSNSWCWISTNEDVYWNDNSYLLDEISPFDGGYHPGTRVSYGTLEHSLLVYSSNIVTSKWESVK